MKIPESYEECDSTHIDLKTSCNLQGNLEIMSSDISVLWASVFITNSHLSDNDLLHIARSMSRSEYSKASVKVTFLKPFSVCRIYSNGRVLIMGTLTEKQAYKKLAKTVRKIKYRTKWKVQIPPSNSYYHNYPNTSPEESSMTSSTYQCHHDENVDAKSDETGHENTKKNKNSRKRVGVDGNGLTWRYVDNQRIYKVSESLKTFKIDQLYCKIVLNSELDLENIYRKLNPKYINVNLFKNYLRFQFNLITQTEKSDAVKQTNNEPLGGSEMYSGTILFNEDLDIGLELERVLENELVSANKTSSCLVFKSGKISILGCSNRSQIIYTFNQLIQYL